MYTNQVQMLKQKRSLSTANSLIYSVIQARFERAIHSLESWVPLFGYKMMTSADWLIYHALIIKINGCLGSGLRELRIFGIIN
jgi:hypothetical protein